MADQTTLVHARPFWSRMRPLNRFVASRIRSGWGPRNTVLLLTTRGRRSGLPRVTPLQFERQDGDYYVGSGRGEHADWFRNLVADPVVQVEVQGQRFAAQAEPVTDLGRVADFLALRLRRHPLMVRAIMTAEGLPLRYAREDLEAFAAAKTMVVLHPVTLPEPAPSMPGHRPRAGLVAALLLTATGLLMVYQVYVRPRQRRMNASR